MLSMNARKEVGSLTIKFWSCTSAAFFGLNDPLCEELEIEKIRDSLDPQIHFLCLLAYLSHVFWC